MKSAYSSGAFPFFWSTLSRHAAWFGVLAALPLATQAPAHAITINIEYTDEGDDPPHDENPSWDPSGVILKAHFQRAKQIWEALLLGPEEYSFDFHWDNDIDGLGLTTDGIDTYVEINPDWNWFADPTPGDDVEFNVSIGQTLFGGLPESDQATYFPGTAPPGALEVGYRGTGSAAVASTSGVAGINASNGYDLLSTIVHEFGHVLGISGEEPGEFNIDPQHVGGVGDVLVLEDEGGGHLAGHGAVPFLMCESCGSTGVRRFATATDILVIAEDQGITNVHLERVGNISGGFWSDPQRWIGNAAPNVTQDVYVSYGGGIALSADQQARNLRVSGGFDVDAQTHQLTVDGVLNFDGGALSVGFGGTIAADRLNGEPGAIETTLGSLVQFNNFTPGSSAATTASFNGSVRIGYDAVAFVPGAPAPVFDPSSIATWNVAEELAIGGGSTTPTLAINSGADFTSHTGRIGANSGGAGGRGQVLISGNGSTWTIDGALDATKGSLNVVDDAALSTGSATLGGSAGQMNAAVINADWNVGGHLDVGPPTVASAGLGTLTIQNSGDVNIVGDLRVHGASSLLSEVTVTSAGRLDVDGVVIVGPYSRVTYGANTTADNEIFTNLGNAADRTLGGVTQFTDNATAGFGTFTNNGPTGPFGYGGQTRFDGASRAGFATITNAGPTGAFNYAGKTIFNDSASAGNANITNLPANFAPATTDFYGTSTAANATIINMSGAYPTVAGVTTFHDSSSAGNGTFINDFGPSGGSDGQFIFNDASTAEQGTFINGPVGGYGHVIFNENSTAAQANIVLRGPGDSRVYFYGNSSAGAANIDVGSIAVGPSNEFNTVNFFENSTAANSTLTVRADGGRANFSGGTAGNAQIVAHGSARPNSHAGAVGGQVLFGSSVGTAGNATITAQGATAAGAISGAGGLIVFLNGGHAGAATLIANGGASAAGGGSIRFQSGGVGDSARLVVNAGAYADFSHNAFHGGTAIGSIEGAGRFSLGGSRLTVGNLNTNTTVSGTIIDTGGIVDGVGGMLTKTGTGTLTFAGTNVYSGLTTVNQGTLVVNGSIAGATLVKNGGTLNGIGTLKNVTVESGGVFAPGTSPGTITVAGLTLMSGATLEFELGAARDHIVVTNNGAVTLGGVLNLSLLDGFNPPLGQPIPLFEGSIGSITGQFSAINAPFFNGHTLNVVYGVNQVTLQVGDANFLAADFDENGAVNGADLMRWKTNFGTGATHLLGNADGDGDVDGADFLVWQRQLGGLAGLASAPAVPEPASLALATLALLGATRVRANVSKRSLA